MKRIRRPISDKLMKFTYPCGCKYFVTMDLAQSPPIHYHDGEFHKSKQETKGKVRNAKA